jgi:putative ATP-dependent endonuclease of OLD family
MKLVDISIENFRGIKKLLLPLDELTILIGENNTGKSTILEALKFILTRGLGTRRSGRFREYDFHLTDDTATPQESGEIKIKLHFAELQEDEWPDSIVQQLSEVIQPDMGTGLNHIWLQVEGRFNPDAEIFETKWDFLNSSDAALVLKNATALHLLQRFVPLFYLSALRDATQEFGQRGQFWNSFLKSIQLPDDERANLEEMLQTVNSTVIESNEGLNQVIQQIANANCLVSLDASDPVILEAIPTRIFDMVGKIQVFLKSPLGAKLPLQRYGEGTQSLAVLLLFQAFAEVNLAEAYDQDSSPILALEEPEAHLHPSAIRTLGQFMKDMSGQKIVSSHSGDLISRVSIHSIRRLYKEGDETKIGMIHSGVLSDRELQAVDYNIRLTRGAYLFSRCWVLVEGESDFHLMPLLGEILGLSQDRASFSVLEISQVIDKGEPFIKTAKALGIQWFMMADGDPAGIDYTNRANNYLESGELLSDRAVNLPSVDIEHEFWNNGFDNFIKNMVSHSRQTRISTEAAGDSVKETKLLIKAAIKAAGGKPAFARSLIGEVNSRGSASIPTVIQNIFARITQLVGE